MPMAGYIARLRQKVGHDLLLLPSVAVFPHDENGRVLLVREGDSGSWAAIGGAIEPDESPEEAVRREAQEEAGVVVELNSILRVVGGREFRMTYPNGDETSYVTTVFDGRVVDGVPRPDGDETLDVRWWPVVRLPYGEMSAFTRALMTAAGLAPLPQAGAGTPH